MSSGAAGHALWMVSVSAAAMNLRLAAAHAVDIGSHVVREAISLVEADALHRSHPLERLARDTEMVRTTW